MFVYKGMGLFKKVNFVWTGIHPLEYGLTTHSSSMSLSPSQYAPRLFTSIKMTTGDRSQMM